MTGDLGISLFRFGHRFGIYDGFVRRFLLICDLGLDLPMADADGQELRLPILFGSLEGRHNGSAVTARCCSSSTAGGEPSRGSVDGGGAKSSAQGRSAGRVEDAVSDSAATRLMRFTYRWAPPVRLDVGADFSLGQTFLGGEPRPHRNYNIVEIRRKRYENSYNPSPI